VPSDKRPREGAEDLIRMLVPDWRPTPRQGLWAIRIGIILGLLVAIGYYGVTLWDWIKLLIVPAAIAGAGLWFTQQQRVRELQIADERAQTDQQIADQRRQDDALQAYLDQIGQLLLDKERPLRQSKEDDEVQTLARARTLTVLRRLDGERKGRILQFLYDSDLISRERLVLALSKADLSEAYLSEAYLVGSNLRYADLSGANLREANLSEADLSGANLSGANLSGAVLSGAYLSYTSLADAKVTPVQFAVAESLEGATMPNGQKYENWL
jgi:Pentapeptide repeats (8 copies)